MRNFGDYWGCSVETINLYLEMVSIWMVQTSGPENAIGIVVHLEQSQRPRADQGEEGIPAGKLRM